jgi:RNA polymerase sigma-70 factor (ECF subfamily)
VSGIGTGSEIDFTELVRRITVGDRGAEDELFFLYKKGVFIVIRRIVKDEFVTEDLSQETFKIALENIRRGDLHDWERLSGYICGVARNLAIEYMRKMRRSQVQEEIGKAEQLSDPLPDQFEQFWSKEKADIVRRVLNELKVKRDREVLFRYYIAEEDKDHICADLGLKRKQFSGIIFRALKRYKELYEKHTGETQ